MLQPSPVSPISRGRLSSCSTLFSELGRVQSSFFSRARLQPLLCPFPHHRSLYFLRVIPDTLKACYLGSCAELYFYFKSTRRAREKPRRNIKAPITSAADVQNTSLVTHLHQIQLHVRVVSTCIPEQGNTRQTRVRKSLTHVIAVKRKTC